MLFLTASIYFLNKKDGAKQLIRIQELVDLIDTQRGSIKQQEKKIQDYAHFDKPFAEKKRNKKRSD
jgi:hypothetical protein